MIKFRIPYEEDENKLNDNVEDAPEHPDHHHAVYLFQERPGQEEGRDDVGRGRGVGEARPNILQEGAWLQVGGRDVEQDDVQGDGDGANTELTPNC